MSVDFRLQILSVLLVDVLVTLFIDSMKLVKLPLIMLQSFCVGVFVLLVLLLDTLLVGLITLTKQLSELSQLMLVLIVPIL